MPVDRLQAHDDAAADAVQFERIEFIVSRSLSVDTGFCSIGCPLNAYKSRCPSLTQAVWKRFSYPNNWKEPGAMDLEATG